MSSTSNHFINFQDNSLKNMSKFMDFVCLHFCVIVLSLNIINKIAAVEEIV